MSFPKKIIERRSSHRLNFSYALLHNFHPKKKKEKKKPLKKRDKKRRKNNIDDTQTERNA